MSTVASSQPRLINTGQRVWTPAHRTYTQPLQALYDLWNPTDGQPLERYNATTRALQSLIAEAVNARTRLRALGRGWSLSGAPATEGWLLNTKPLNLFFEVGQSMVHPDYRGDPAGLRFAQCGNSILELNRHLQNQGRALRTTGASNGQTIAGALSTETHGSSPHLGAIPEYVAGLHLVVDQRYHFWLERASAPATTDAFAARLGAHPVRDDWLFDAALVSFGSFGLIHGVLIESDPLYLLEVYRRRMPLDDTLLGTMRTLDFSRLPLPHHPVPPEHFAVVINPYDLPGGAYVISMYRHPYRPDYPRRPQHPEGFGPGDDALAFVGMMTDAIPASIPVVARNLLARAYPVLGPLWGTVGEIFSNTALRGAAAGTAVGIPLARATEVLDLALELNQRAGPFAVILAVRYVRASRAILGWTRYAPTTCVFELDAPLSNRTWACFRLFWQALRERGIPHTFHWGKMLPMESGWVGAAYGLQTDRWLAARHTLLGAEARPVFSSRYLEELGLAS